jgi:hypothetical protein
MGRLASTRCRNKGGLVEKALGRADVLDHDGLRQAAQLRLLAPGQNPAGVDDDRQLGLAAAVLIFSIR